MLKHPLVALPIAGLLGFLFPVCECAIVPVVRHLIKKAGESFPCLMVYRDYFLGAPDCSSS
ncbi:permease [Brevibacillus sp. SAFN-007a]|uniref:permease n=1 Tax=Brevibacillus sp. SAFN-007a TaxID=3436862 RepID=UPI003F7DDA5F